MDKETKLNLGEGVPLNADAAANIILNAGKNTKVNSPNGTVIHLKSDKSSSAPNVGLHINTTFSVSSSKKIKGLFIVNFTLSIICMVLSCSIAFYYYNEFLSMRKQLEVMKDHILHEAFKVEAVREIQASAFTAPKPLGMQKRQDERIAKADENRSLNEPIASARKFFVEDWGNEPILLVDSSQKKNSEAKGSVKKDDFPLQKKGMLIAHFTGTGSELELPMPVIGPWVADHEVSSAEGLEKVVLSGDGNVVTVKEDGIYLVYAQMVYLTRTPSSYYVFARRQPELPRLLTACAAADDGSARALDEAQLSCATQTLARLRAGDVLNLSQRERNKTVWLKPGYSHFGLVKLAP